MPTEFIVHGKSARRISFTRLLVLGFGLPLLLGPGVVLYLGLAGAEENTRSLLSRLVQHTMASVVQQVDGHLNPVEEQLEYLADHLARHPRERTDPLALRQLLRGALASTPQVLGLNYLDPDQGVTYVSRDALAADWAASLPQIRGRRIEPYLRSPPEGLTWLAPTWSPRLGHQVLPALMPVRVEGGLVGLLVAPITVDELSAFLARLSAQVGLQLFILYGDDAVLAYPQRQGEPGYAAGADRALPTLAEVKDPALAAFRSPQRRRSDWLQLRGIDSHRLKLDGLGYLYFYQSLSGYGPRPWLVGGYLQQASMPVELRRLVTLLVAGLVLMLLVSILVVWFSRRIGAAVRRILAGLEAIGRRDLAAVAPMDHSRVRELDRVASAFNRMLADLREHQKLEQLFGQYVPTEVARQMLAQEGALAPQQARATVLFCDLEDFTALAEPLRPGQIVTLLNSWFSALVALIEAEGGLVTQFQGDAVLAIFNVPRPQADHARRALAAALKIQALTRERRFEGQVLACRIGINTGEVVAGSVGARDRLSYTVHGDAVNLAARLESLNKAHGTRVLLSEASAREIGGDDLVAIAEVEIRGRRRHETLYTPLELLGAGKGPSAEA